MKEIAVEMVCLGNICRSPMAAAVLHNKATKLKDFNLIVSSSGTSSYHIGEGAHKLSLKTWEAAGYKYDHEASQFNPKSFDTQDFILCMDLTNRAMVLNAAKTEAQRAKVFMLRSFDPALSHIDVTSRQGEELVVPDPWGEDIDSYQRVLGMIELATDGFILALEL
ncbi:MAG: low molecular weight protein-tyrosine-phosphatase [Actinomycetes bacterium]